MRGNSDNLLTYKSIDLPFTILFLPFLPKKKHFFLPFTRTLTPDSNPFYLLYPFYHTLFTLFTKKKDPFLPSLPYLLLVFSLPYLNLEVIAPFYL